MYVSWLLSNNLYITTVLYVPFALILTTAIALFTSTLGVLVKDTQQAIQALMRMVFFASSILIVPPEGIVKDVMKLNPIYYLVEAYRSAVLHKEWYFITHWELTLYNMFIIILLFILRFNTSYALSRSFCRFHVNK